MRLRFLITFIGLALLTGCVKDSSDFSGAVGLGDQLNAKVSAAATVELNTIAEGSDSGFIVSEFAVEEPTLMVLDTEAELDDFWQKHSYIFDPKPAKPVVDFSSEMLLVVVDKVEPNTGYYFEMDGLYEVDGKLRLEVTKYVPGAGTVAGAELTVPYQIAKTALSDVEVILQLSEREH